MSRKLEEVFLNYDKYVLRKIADYQFGEGIGSILFPDDIVIEKSKKTGKMRKIILNGKVIATIRARDGLIALTIYGAEIIRSKTHPPKRRVMVINEVADVIKEGRNVFAKHVKNADPEIRPGEEVIVVNEKDELLAVGKALLNGEEMTLFRSGVAVKVRSGVKEK
ncbi:MAG: pseudouridine synthase [archaeon YNP-WB-062]|jgi:predicted RNA-binding protein (TIGR00451 family)|nr:pseudouridine synthase [Candidatus Culexarchaeum yellowstonense]MCS7367115.1 pseudouridine synthase [Candidatus Culexarchaeum yellowstonense]